MSPVRHHTIQQRMIETIDRQLASGSRSPWVLKMGPEKLRMVRSFVLSFTVEPSDRVIPYMSFPEPEGVETADPGEPADIEVIAERLAKVEQRQDEFEQRTIKALNAHDERFDTQSELRIRSNRAFDQRIDKVAEIIGERVSGLVDELSTLRDTFDRAETRTVNLFDRHSTDIASLLHPDAPAFPTGGAHTAEAAAEAVLPVCSTCGGAGEIDERFGGSPRSGVAPCPDCAPAKVLPVPQRGDRVRLEGARSNFGTLIEDGWWDVHGQLGAEFQIGRGDGLRVASPLYWVAVDSPGLKEVRHAQP